MSKCIGCGITLQNTFPDKEGYASSKDYSLCERCFRIKYYNENKKVTDRNTLNIFKIINDNDVVVYVSSLLTLDISYINDFKNVILVLTKRDIIPKSVKDSKIINYVKDNYNIDDVIIVSANKHRNLDVLYDKLCKFVGKKIYFVGETNSGKSSLINELINLYGNEVGKITTSSYPNTTMSVIDIRLNDLMIYDTPGIVNKNSIINVLDNGYLKKINSKKEIKPITFQIKGNGSILVDNLFRVDYETEESSLIFYVSNNLNIRSISMKNDIFINDKIISLNNISREDIIIADIGYIKVTNNVNISIRYKDILDIKIRNNLI